jgi:protein-disulfide isomerase
MKVSEVLLNGALGATALCAVATSLLVVDRVLELGLLQRSPEVVAEHVADWREYGKAGHRVGAQDATVSLVVFADYQCPYCAVLHEVVKEILARHSSDVAAVFRHFPLKEETKEAALAAECAGAQGRFLAYHELLYSKRDSIGRLSWRSFGEQAGVPDLERLEACLATGEAEMRVKEDVDAARRLGGRGTPLILLNDRLLHGAPPALENLVEQALAQVR